MKYKELIKQTNKFMEYTGIRKYCQEVCGGKCCTICPGRARIDNSCGKFVNNCNLEECKNILYCTSYLCETIARYIKHIVGIDVFYKVLRIHNWIYQRQENGSLMERYTVDFYNKFKEEDLGMDFEINKKYIKQIKETMDLLTQYKIDIYSLNRQENKHGIC